MASASSNGLTPTQAREAAGLTVEWAARRSGVSPVYLRRLETNGGFSYALACRLAALYRCGVDAFLFGTNTNGTRRSNGKTNDTQEARSDATARRGGKGRSLPAPKPAKDAATGVAK